MANLPSLAELLKSQQKPESGNDSPHSSLADLLAPSKEKSNNDNNKKKKQQQPSLADLLTFSSSKTNQKENTPVSSDTPSLANLLKQNTINIGGDTFKHSNQEIPSLNSLLSPTNHQTKLPSLTDILKNSPDRATLASSPQKIPDLSSLLKDININNSSHNQIVTRPLIESVQEIKLSDLAAKHNISDGPPDRITYSTSSIDLPTNDRFTKSYAYMNHSSSFGKILGAQYKRCRSSRLCTSLQIYPMKRKNMFDSCVMYTSGMLGTKTVAANVYQFNDPSPDDFVKKIQDKAFERDGRK